MESDITYAIENFKACISAENVIKYSLNSDKRIINEFWKAWNAVEKDVWPLVTDQNFKDHITVLIPKDEFSKNCKHGPCGIMSTPFYDELTTRLQIYYTKEADIQHEEYCFTLKDGEQFNKCVCGKDITEVRKELQEIFDRLRA